MMRPITVAALLLITALAGCLGEEADGAQSDDGLDGGDAGGQGNGTADAGNGTDAGAAPENAPPTANLTANVTNGSAPLAVSFDLTGEDADGDNLTWTFDADGDGQADANGTELPASFEFTYEQAGNYTATLDVIDEEDAAAAADLLIVVEVPTLAGPLICDRPDASSYGDTLYTLDEGGTWVFRESNGMPGLQVGNTHPTGPGGGGVGFANPDWEDCEEADQMVF